MISTIQSISGVCALLLLWYMRIKIRSLAGLLFSPYQPNKFRTQNTKRMERTVDFSFVLSFIVAVQCVIIICRFIFYTLNLKSNKITDAYNTEPAKAYYIHIELPFSKHVQNYIRVNVFSLLLLLM